MMDPASILGIVSASGTIISCIGGTIKDLNDIRRKLGSTDTIIRLLISELSTIKSALGQIHDWATYNLTESQARRLGDNLDTTLDGCKLAMEALAEDVSDLAGVDTRDLGMRTFQLGFRDRARFVWNETTIKGHQERLSRQVSALQLLLSAVQCHSISEQTRLLQSPQNVRVIQRVADDASTIRATRSQRGSTGTPSVMSRDNPTVSARASPWDEQLLSSEAYRRVMGHQRSKSELQPGPRAPRIDVQIQDSHSDEGYETMSKTTTESAQPVDLLSPVWSPASGRRPVRPYEIRHNMGVNPDNINRSQSMRNRATPFSPTINIAPSPPGSPPTRELNKKKSFWSFGRKSDSTLDPTNGRQSSKSPTPSSRRGRRGSDNNSHSSIDFASPDGMNCPPIIRAAQAGSIVEIESLLDGGADIEECHVSSGRSAMAVAAHCGNADVVELLLRYDAKISKRDAYSSTPLHLAASRGHIDVMAILLAEEASIEEKGPNEKTPLRLSCDNGHYEAAELLLSYQAKVNARDEDNITSLHAAAGRGDTDIVDLLIRNGAHVEAKDGQFMAALHHAAEKGRKEVVDHLLNKKADIETPGKEGKTPLISAASAGSLQVVELLLRRKASLKKTSSGEMSALHWAAFNGHAEVADFLLEKKASVNVVNTDGRTPLHLAVMAEQFSVVELLLRKNASIEAQCKSRLRPLHYAASSVNADIVRILISSGALLEAETSGQQRPLHFAAMSGMAPIVSILLSQGADTDARDGRGDRPLLLASARGHTEVVKTLLDSGAPLRSKFNRGRSHEDSPLCLAARRGHAKIVTLLISQGASVREKDESDWQPLRYAAHYGHPEVVEILLMNGASLSGIQSWGFDLTADRVGFANSVYIPEDRKEAVMRLLRDAEDRERTTQERKVAQANTNSTPAPAASAQNGLSELDHGLEIARPPARELFSPDNTRYTTESESSQTEQSQANNEPARVEPPRNAIYASSTTFPSRTPSIARPWLDPRERSGERSGSAISAWSTENTTAYSAEPSLAASTPFSFSSTPPPATMRSSAVSALDDHEPNSSSTNHYVSPMPPRSATQTTLDTVQEDWRPSPQPPERQTTQDTTQEDPRPGPQPPESINLSGDDRLAIPRPRPPIPRTRSDTPQADEETITLDTFEGQVQARRDRGFTTFHGPGSTEFNLDELEAMIKGYRQAGVTHVGRAEDEFPPKDPPEEPEPSSPQASDTDGTLFGTPPQIRPFSFTPSLLNFRPLSPFNFPPPNLQENLQAGRSIPSSTGVVGSAIPPPPTDPPPPPPTGASSTTTAQIHLRTAERFASSPIGVFEMASS